MALQRLTQERLRRTASIDVRRVDEIDALVEGFFQTGARLVGLDSDAVGQPRAQGDFRNFEIAAAKLAVFHDWASVGSLNLRGSTVFLSSSWNAGRVDEFAGHG